MSIHHRRNRLPNGSAGGGIRDYAQEDEQDGGQALMSFPRINNLEIACVAGKGDLDKERVILIARRECDLIHYLVLDTTYNEDGTISDKNRHIYWFPSHLVKPRDYVLVYSKAGKNRTFVDKEGDTIHVFFWGLDHTVWNEDGDAVTLVNTARIAYKKV
jgi:hypothetical protein